MAQLKDTVVNGNIRVTDAVLTTTAQVNTIQAPTASNGTTYGPGTNGQVLKSNGSSVYWATDSAGTDANVAQTATTTNASYELLFSGTADNTTRTEGARKTSTLTYNPSTKALATGGTVNGYTLAGASAKGVDTSIAAASTSANLPTSQAVASFVEGKGYTTNTGTVTGVKVNGTTKSPTSGVVDIGTVITSHQDISGKADKSDTVLDTTLSRGRRTDTTVGTGSFAFGYDVTASGNYSHAEGFSTTASGYYSHTEGVDAMASNYGAHAEGSDTKAFGKYSHSEGFYTIAQRHSQHAGGEYNVADTEGTIDTRGAFAEIIGNGTANDARSNARALDWSGNEYLGGNLYVGCDSNSENGFPVTKGIYLTDNDDTWAKVWAKINTLSNNENAFLSLTSVAMGVLTQGLRSIQCSGFITRQDSSAFNVFLRVTRLMNFNINISSASSSGFTYNEAVYNPTYNELDQTAGGYALDARKGKELKDMIMLDKILYQASAASHTFNVSTNSRNIIIHTGDGVTRTYIAMVYCASDGSISTNEILKGANVTSVTTSTKNKITITMGSASAVYVRTINIRGTAITN